MKYIVTDGTNTESYEAEMAYIAVRSFMNDFNSSMDNISVRIFGGTNKSAQSVWPRSRPLTTIS